ncbi:hypothetical protein LNO89_02865 [Klebsiella pneumoniae subsp. pneumoniae]|nr:hypothetical protein [Klebsiella pneumoniae subsp. pneumoniae]
MRRNWQGDIFIVIAGFRVEQNRGDLLLMGDAQHKGGVVEGLLSEQGQRLRLYFSGPAGRQIRRRRRALC